MEDFSRLSTVKVIYRYIQACHHAYNLRETPKGLIKIKNKLDLTLKPAIPNSHIRRLMSNINQQWTFEQMKALRQHYQIQKSLALSALRARTKITSSEFEEQWQHALSWTRKNFGKKLVQITTTEAKGACRKALTVGGTTGPGQAPQRTAGPRTYAQVVAPPSLLDIRVEPPRPAHKPMPSASPNEPWQLVNPKKAAKPSAPQSQKGYRAVSGPQDPLSNFYHFPHAHANNNHHSVEQVYQIKKAAHFGHRAAMDKIKTTNRSSESKKVSDSFFKSDNHRRAKRNNPWIAKLDREWDGAKKRHVVRNLLREKADQCPPFVEALKASGDSEILHNVPDRYWGTGTMDPARKAGGINTFGLLLMDLRRELMGPTTHGSRFRALHTEPPTPSAESPELSNQAPPTSAAQASWTPSRAGKRRRTTLGSPPASKRAASETLLLTSADSSTMVKDSTPTQLESHKQALEATPSPSCHSAGDNTLSSGNITSPDPRPTGDPPREEHLDVPLLAPQPGSLTSPKPGPSGSQTRTLAHRDIVWTEAREALPDSPEPPSLATRAPRISSGEPLPSQPLPQRTPSPKARRRSAPPAPNHRVPIRPICHKANSYEEKNAWKLPSTKLPKIVVLGDSLIGRTRAIKHEIAPDTKIISYSGATFKHILTILRKEKDNSFPAVKHLILSIGLNCHNQSAERTANKHIRELYKKAKVVFPEATIYFTEFVQKLDEKCMKNLRDFEATFRQLGRVLKPVDNPSFHTDNYHWDKETAENMVNNWLSQIDLN